MERAVLLSFFVIVMQHCQVGTAVFVEATFNDTRCEEAVVCPDEPLLFNCTVTGSPVAEATVRLPTGEEVDILSTNMTVGAENLPDGVTVHSHDVMVDGSNTDYILTLAINNASLLTGNLTCDSLLTSKTEEATCPVTNDPTPPGNLSQNSSANTGTSTEIYWQSPESTGGQGVSISGYTVRVDGREPETVTVGSEVFTRTLSGLDYNTRYSVAVTAINSCDFSSPPVTASVFIEAGAPPHPKISQTQLRCDVRQEMSDIPVEISWMYGKRDNGVVYPRNENVTVGLTPGKAMCDNVTATDATCTVLIAEDAKYTVTLTVSNDVGISRNSTSFDSTRLLAEEILLPESLNVEITINENCSNAKYEAVFEGGLQREGDDTCMYLSNLRRSVSPGGKEVFKIPLEPGQHYCYKASLMIGDVTVSQINDAGVFSPPEPTDPPMEVGIIIGACIAAVVVLILCVLIVLIMLRICFRKKDKGTDKNKFPLSSTGPDSPEYEEPETVDSGPMYQEPSTISRTPHPTTGELYTEVQPGSKSRKNKEQETGPMYQDPSTIEHETATSGDVYAMPQKKVKKGKKGKKEEEPELTEEQTAALYSVPDRKGQKAKSEGLTYADLDIHHSAKKAPPSAGSTYVDIKYD
jgi:hypothetical protein